MEEKVVCEPARRNDRHYRRRKRRVEDSEMERTEGGPVSISAMSASISLGCTAGLHTGEGGGVSGRVNRGSNGPSEPCTWTERPHGSPVR